MPLRARLLADFSSLADGSGNAPLFGVSEDGTIIACVRRTAESPVEDRGIGVFPKSRFDRPADYHVVAWKEGRIRDLGVQEESLSVHHVQAVPDGVLLASARCAWREEGPERNGVVVDWSGRVLRRMTLGDGIKDLRALADGTLWVSYFDEGVFGNYGWGNPGPSPLGAAGLNAFGPAGDLRFSYDAEAAGTDTICDAYALNAAGPNDVWVYFYTEFPLVRVGGGAYRRWSLGLAGAHAFAVRGDRVLLYGDYERSGLARRVRLGDDGRARVEGEEVVEGPDGRPLGTVPAIGVGDCLYLFSRGQVLTLSLE